MRGCLAGCPCSAFSWQLAVFPRVVGVCFWGACFRVPFFYVSIVAFFSFFRSFILPFSYLPCTTGAGVCLYFFDACVLSS